MRFDNREQGTNPDGTENGTEGIGTTGPVAPDAPAAPPNAAAHGAPVEPIPRAVATAPDAAPPAKPVPAQADGATPPVLASGEPHGHVHRFRPVHERVGKDADGDPIYRDYMLEEWVPEADATAEEREAFRLEREAAKG